MLLVGLIVCAPRARAQDPIRPWLDWRTITTPHYAIHFPRDLEDWVHDVAARVESIDSAIVAEVGYRSDKRIQVVVDDPFGLVNGYALPLIERPVTVWWATPPGPRDIVGDYASWGELLATHELTHLAHLTRPSRNPFRRNIWNSAPANFGPIARAPRWVIEGYATLVEGRVTGTGRPNGIWRPALLRQLAIEGQLPTYAELNSTSDFGGGEFPYLNGSAFLEWLAGREGDSSLVHVWRRMTARRVRGFDEAFSGVYGDPPAILYGRHVAELTRDAMLAKATLERAGLVEGELIQHRTWTTGDPAISPDGSRVAISVGERDAPSSIEVWSTEPEAPDTAALRHRVAELTKDPLDVPDRRFYPPRKRARATLEARNGRPFRNPRWLRDNHRVLLTKAAPRPDGTSAFDLYVWNTETGAVGRITRGASITQADPNPAGDDAIATQCHRGRCDVVRIDLTRGTTQTVLAGNARRSYYRPRYSRDGQRFAASVNEDGLWRVIVAGRNGSGITQVGPADGASRYDAAWRGGDSLVVVSERGGVANLEVVSISTGGVRLLTRVTGAAVAPDVNPRDSSVWFLTLHSRGFDVRRLPSDAAGADPAVPVASSDFGFAGARLSPAPLAIGTRPVAPARPYGSGPWHARWLPGITASADGLGAFMTIFAGDIIGRLNTALTGSIGERGTPSGASLRTIWRFPRTPIELGIHAMIHEPSLGRDGQLAAVAHDATSVHGVLAQSINTRGDGWYAGGRLGIAWGNVRTRIDARDHARQLGFGEWDLRFQQMSGTRGFVEQLRGSATIGRMDANYHRIIQTLQVRTVGRDMIPIEAGITYGRVGGSPHPFELLAVGGLTSPGLDPALLAQRYAMPMLPTGIAVGRSLLAWRAATPLTRGTLFYEAAAIADGSGRFKNWQRAAGIETRLAFPPIPIAATPAVESRGGVAYTFDEPFRRKLRVYLELRVAP